MFLSNIRFGVRTGRLLVATKVQILCSLQVTAAVV